MRGLNCVFGVLLLATVGPLAGCARPAEDARSVSSADARADRHEEATQEIGRNPAEYAVTFASAPADTVPPAPARRLDHTVVLGSDPAIWQPAASSAAAADGRASTTVIVQNNVQIAPNYGYGYGYGYGYPTGAATGSPAVAQRTAAPAPVLAAPAPGGDWPAPTSYGPRALR